MAERTEGPRGPQITVEHLTASLSQIETWCRAVREALDSIPDKHSVRFPETVETPPLVAQSQLQRPKVCPPPEPESPSKPGGKDSVN